MIEIWETIKIENVGEADSLLVKIREDEKEYGDKGSECGYVMNGVLSIHTNKEFCLVVGVTASEQSSKVHHDYNHLIPTFILPMQES